MSNSTRVQRMPWFRATSAGLQVAYLFIGLAAIAFWTYLFGHPLLEGNIAGSDSGYALALITWINRWFPELPGWYPLQGAGTSSIVQYPYGAPYFVAVLSRVSGLSLTEAYRMTQLASVVATGWGIYLLAWRKLRSQTMALIAGLLYPISMAAWRWLAVIGLFAQSSSLALFAPAFLLFDAYLLWGIGSGQEHSVRRRRLILAASAIAFCLLMVTHIITAAVFAMTVLAYAFLRAVLQKKGMRLSSLFEYGKRSLIGLGSGFALAAFWWVPFLHITSFVNRDGPIGEFGLHQLPYSDLLSVIGLKEAGSFYDVSFASPVLILAAAGSLLALRRSKFVVAIAIMSVGFVIFTAMPGIWIGIVKPFVRIWANLYGRAVIPTMIFLPIIAGYGAVALPRMVINSSSRLMRRVFGNNNQPSQLPTLWSAVNVRIASMIGIAIAIIAFIYLRHAPPGYGDYPGYGFPHGREWWPFAFENSTMSINQWPSFAISDDDVPGLGRTADALSSNLGVDATNRLYLSRYFGSTVMVLPLYSDSSTVGIYYYQGGLNAGMRSYMSAAYWKEGYASHHEVDEFARWLGVDYVAAHRVKDPLGNFEGDNWEPISLPDDKIFTNISVRGFQQSPGIASLYMRPEILVIGGHENGVYDQVFRLFNSGLVESQEATIVEGSHQIDDYSAEELAEFEVVFLHGYGYKDRDRAWDLLEDYVRAGGALYVDTGWQYRVPEWEMEHVPPVLPVNDLIWKDVKQNDRLELVSSLGWVRGDDQEFAPMAWGDQPWGVSSPTGEVREWATPLLAASNTPLVAAGEFGNGRVVWSGMNLIAHIRSYESAEEKAFLQSLIQWLIPEAEFHLDERPSVRRDHPDSIELGVNGAVAEGTYVIWRENHTPDWRATAEVGNHQESLPIYRAGPGMMLIHLPASPDGGMIVRLEHSLSGVRGIGRVLTSLSAILMFLSIVGLPRLPRRRHRIGDPSPEGKKFQSPQSGNQRVNDASSGDGYVSSIEKHDKKEPITVAESNQMNDPLSSNQSLNPPPLRRKTTDPSAK